MHLRGNQLFHDFITQTVLRSLQSGIVVMGVIDAFVYAQNYHPHATYNPGNFEDCMEGTIRLLTATTPTHAHAHQSLCLGERPFDIPHQRFRLPSVKAKYLNLRNTRTTRGDDFEGWAVHTDGGTHASEGENHGRRPRSRWKSIFHVWSSH